MEWLVKLNSIEYIIYLQLFTSFLLSITISICYRSIYITDNYFNMLSYFSLDILWCIAKHNHGGF